LLARRLVRDVSAEQTRRLAALAARPDYNPPR
jgi:hypothetical protein